jgi:hypothetical protein
MIDWPVALTAASHAIQLARDLRLIDKEISEADLKLKIADLTSTLSDLKMTLTEAKEDASIKDNEIARLKALNQRVLDETIELYGYRYRKHPTKLNQPAGNPFDLLPNLSSFIRRVCSGYAPDRGVLRTRMV